MNNLDLQTMDTSSTHEWPAENKLNNFLSHSIQDVSLESPSLESPGRSVVPDTARAALVNPSHRQAEVPKIVTIRLETFNELRFRLARYNVLLHTSKL